MDNFLEYTLVMNAGKSTLFFKVDKLLVLNDVDLYFLEKKLVLKSNNILYQSSVLNKKNITLLKKIEKIVFKDFNDNIFSTIKGVVFNDLLLNI